MGIAAGSMGACSALEHAPAANIASLASTEELSTYMSPTNRLDGGLSGTASEETLLRSYMISQRSLFAKLEARRNQTCHKLRFGRLSLPNLIIRTLSDPGNTGMAHFTARLCRNSHPIAAVPFTPQTCSHAALEADTACFMCGKTLDCWREERLTRWNAPAVAIGEQLTPFCRSERQHPHHGLRAVYRHDL